MSTLSTSYIHYCRSLEFDQEPDYLYLIQLFETAMSQHQFEMDFKFDWMMSKEPKKARQPRQPTNFQTTLPKIKKFLIQNFNQ